MPPPPPPPSLPPSEEPNPLTPRVERLEELAMFADHRHDTLAATVEELSRQVAAMHGTIESLTKRLKDAERAATGGAEQTPTRDDEIPPHNAF